MNKGGDGVTISPIFYFRVSLCFLGQFIGGCNDGPSQYGGINTLNSSRRLDDMLKAAGAI